MARPPRHLSLTTYIALLLLYTQAVLAHTYIYAIWVNGKDMGRGDGKPVQSHNGKPPAPAGPAYIRAVRNNDPVKNVMSRDMTCNMPGTAAPRYLDVKGGDRITIEWVHDDRRAGDDVLASSHKGPVQTYLAPANTNGNGPVWVKIQSGGYDNGEWATDRLIKNKGKYTVSLPHVQSGSYLLRSEILGLHEGDRDGGAQFYMGCVQLRVSSSGGSPLPQGISIPGAYSRNEKGIRFNLYTPNKGAGYVAPGGSVKRIA